MKYTLNQVIKRLENIAESHLQIKGFGYGDLWEVDVKDVSFPYMFIQLQPSQVQGKNVRLNFDLLIMDQTGENNELEVLSDSLLTALDVRALLNDPEYDSYYQLDDNSQINDFFTEKFSFRVSGLNMRLTFNIINLKDRCSVPL